MSDLVPPLLEMDQQHLSTGRNSLALIGLCCTGKMAILHKTFSLFFHKQANH